MIAARQANQENLQESLVPERLDLDRGLDRADFATSAERFPAAPKRERH
jgi:hypothetical protein